MISSGIDPLSSQASLSGLARSAMALGQSTAGSAREVADGFESLFLFQLLEPLEKSGEALFGSGAEGRTFSGLFRQVLADQMARARPLGIADQVEKALNRQQGTQETPPGRLPEGGIQG